MTPKERMAVALSGGKPDRAPICPIYDFGYLMNCIGREPREFVAASARERIEFIEAAFRRHDVDGYYVHAGTNDTWVEQHHVEKLPEYWLVTDQETGARHRLLPDGWRAEADGTPIPRAPSSDGISNIRSASDLEAHFGLPQSAEAIRRGGRYGPLAHLCREYHDHHFSFQVSTPLVAALNSCGGYVEGLTTLATDRDLFKELLERHTRAICAQVAPGQEAGADSVWFTSYYTGADTISPRDYAELVFPLEYEICAVARDAGLYVLDWFLGDLLPILDQVMELPLDALVLEQGRKRYVIDPVEIRRRVGPRFCLFGFGFENDYCTFNRRGLRFELERQFQGAGADGAFVVGTPIMPPNAQPDAVDYYFEQARKLGRTGDGHHGR